MDGTTKVAVIVITFNSARFVPECFDSLALMNRAGLDVDVIVIDNASKDVTVQLLHSYSFAELHLSPSNLGFAGGNNLGIRMALDRGCEYVYLLNHDTEVTPDFLVEAVATAKRHANAGSVQSLLLLSPEKTQVNSTGNAIHFLGFGYCLDYRRTLDDVMRAGGGASSEKGIAYASGAGVLLRASALREVGAFDEELFLYHEDLDLGWRMSLAGYANVLSPNSVVHHKYEFSRSISKYYYMERNRYVVFLKNLRVWSLVVLLPWMLLTELPLFAAALRSGWWKEKLRAYGYFFRAETWRYLGRERAALKRLRKVEDRAIVQLWSSTISYQEVAGTFTKHVANPLMTFAWSVLKLLII